MFLRRCRPISNLPFLSKTFGESGSDAVASVSRRLGRNADTLIRLQKLAQFADTALVKVTTTCSPRLTLVKCLSCVCFIQRRHSRWWIIKFCTIVLNAGLVLLGLPLACFSSYLTNRSFHAVHSASASSTTKLPCSVPQGSVLEPALPPIYCRTSRTGGVSLHAFADDAQF